MAANSKINAAWHADNRMPRNASLEERIRWHQEHARQCACRPMPPPIAAEIEARSRSGTPADTMPPSAHPSLEPLESTLRDFALAYPEATEEFPWGERVIKVRKKIFVFLGIHQGKLYLGAKLPGSSMASLALPFTEPMGYNLARGGWIAATFAPGADVPIDLLQEWIDESYRAVAPKRLASTLDSQSTGR